MSLVFVIGLFESEQRKFDADCKRNGLQNQAVYAKPGKRGILQLHPFKNDVIRALNDYLDRIDQQYDKAHIIVLSYADYPEELIGELQTIAGLGGRVILGGNGTDGWPSIHAKQKIDKALVDAVTRKLWTAMPAPRVPENPKTSEYYRQVADANPYILFDKTVFETCDGVSPCRREFLRNGIDAFVELLESRPSGRIDAFFRARKLDHAQTGGITSTVQIYINGSHKETLEAQTHLKQGDKTTPENAARLYYHLYSTGTASYVIVVYAGKHPDRDITKVIHVPGSPPIFNGRRG